MKYIPAILYIVYLSALILLNGCAATTQSIPAPNTPLPNEGEARISVTRPSDDLYCGDWIEVLDNGKKVGTLACGGSIIWDRPVGKITLTALHYSAGMLTFRFEPYILHTTNSKTYNLYINNLDRENLKTFSTEVYTSASEKSSPEIATVTKGPTPGDRKYNLITVSELETLINTGIDVLIIDNLPLQNFKDGHIPGARSFPFPNPEMLEWDTSKTSGKNKGDFMSFLGVDKDKPLIFYCWDKE